MWSFIDAFPLLRRTSVALEFDPAETMATTDRVDSVMPTLLSLVKQAGSVPLREVLPGLRDLDTTKISGWSLSTRAANTLVRLGISTWGDLGERSLNSLLQARNVGETTVDEIAKHAIIQSVANPAHQTEASTTSVESTPDPKSGSAERELVGFVRQLALWGQLEAGSACLADLLTVTMELPPDLASAWSSLGELDLAGFEAPALSLEDLVVHLRSDMDPTSQIVLDQRILSTDPITLRELGETLGITRERVRQIQVKVEESLERKMGLAAFAPLRWRAESLRNALGDAAPAGHPLVEKALQDAVESVGSARRDEVLALLLVEAGPFQLRDGWLVRNGTKLPVVDELSELADQDRLVELKAAEEMLASHGVHSPYVEFWLRMKAHAVIEGDFVIPRWANVVDNCVARLALRDSPATAEELIAELGSGHNARGVRSRFFEDDRLVRVNKSEWALRRWGLEEYTGLVDEILQRVEEHGGRVAISSLVEDLVSLFSVSDGSVRLYAAAPMFVIEDGYVRRRGADEPYEVSDDISGCRGVFRTGPASLSLLIRVDSEVLRGSGRSLAPSVAATLGVVPGQPRTFEHPAGEVVITWPETSALGPSLGSTRSMALAVGAEEGDRIRLEFDGSLGSLTAERVGAHEDGGTEEKLSMLTGLRPSGDPDSAVAESINSTPTNVRRSLAARGDHEIIELLGTPPTDPSLQAALADLAGVLGPLE